MAETDEGEGFPRGKSTEGATVARHHRLLRNALIFNSLHDFCARQRDGAVGQAFPFGTAYFAKYGKYCRVRNANDGGCEPLEARTRRRCCLRDGAEVRRVARAR